MLASQLISDRNGTPYRFLSTHNNSQRDNETFITFHNLQEAKTFLLKFDIHTPELNNLLHRYYHVQLATCRGKTELSKQLAYLLASGKIKVYKLNRAKQPNNTTIQLSTDAKTTPAPASVGYKETSSPPPSEAKQSKKSWIEIQLLGEDDKPIPNEAYKIELPDGSLKEGNLDSQGLARIDNIDQGTCKICFPDLDKDAWEPIS